MRRKLEVKKGKERGGQGGGKGGIKTEDRSEGGGGGGQKKGQGKETERVEKLSTGKKKKTKRERVNA